MSMPLLARLSAIGLSVFIGLGSASAATTTNTAAAAGAVSLTTAAKSVAYNSGSVTVTVTRTGGSTGAAKVAYRTNHVTAFNEQNYSGTSGELAWANGDTSTRNITVDLLATAFSGTKSFSIDLSNPHGAGLGSTASTVVTISGTPTTTPPVTTPPVTPPVTPPSGGSIKYPAAPTLSGITMIPNRDSVIVKFPAVANARDFRVLVQPTSVAANSNGTEQVTGGTQFCAGIPQHQSRTRYVADTVSKYPDYFFLNASEVNPNNFVPEFVAPPPGTWTITNLDTPPNLAIEVTGVTAGMTVTVEALDRLCPFPGIIGRQHADIVLTHDSDTDHPGNPWIDASSITTFPVVTQAEVIAKYGSLIINGQGWAGGPNVQATPPAVPPFAQPAAANPPVVLARGAITIAPLAAAAAPTSTFFDDFSNSSDTFQDLPLPKWTYPRWTGGQIIRQNSKWTMYGNGYTCCTPTAAPISTGLIDAYVENGYLNTILAAGQDSLAELSMYPRQSAHLNSSSYLHVTYEVPSFATSRRYWVFSLCGSATAGQTLDSTGALKEQVVHTTFFYQNTGMSPSTVGWNCLQILNRQGNSNALSRWEMMYNLNGTRPPVPANKGAFDVADYIYNSIPSISNPTQTAAYTVHPESDVVVLVNKPIPAAYLPEVPGTNQQVIQSAGTSPINVSPLQLDNPAAEIAWFYRVDNNGNPVAPILDDQQLVSPRTKYDLYIRNNRIIMYVNGQARLCNDFTTPTTTLNIADAALGFHQVLYHSTGEFVERFNDPDRGAAYNYRYNSPWVDQRSWDNIGFQENTAAPSDFNPSTCFEHKSLGAENNEP
jgi:hypothetical protein